MTIKLAQIERAVATNAILQTCKPHLDRRQRAVIALRLEHFERMAVRLHYHKNDLVAHGVTGPTLKRYYEMSTDLLLLASLWYPFQHCDMGDGNVAVRGIEAFLLLYDAAIRLLDNDFEAAGVYLAHVKDLSKPLGFGTHPYGGYDKYIKAILESDN